MKNRSKTREDDIVVYTTPVESNTATRREIGTKRFFRCNKKVSTKYFLEADDINKTKLFSVMAPMFENGPKTSRDGFK